MVVKNQKQKQRMIKMLNQVNIVGKVASDLKLKEAKNGRSYTIATLEINKNFKNANGVYEKDLIDVNLWGHTAENVAKYAGAGSIITVSGRLNNRILSLPNEEKDFKTISVIGERIAFIQTKPPGHTSQAKSEPETTADELPSFVNQAMLIGRTTRDTTLQFTPAGKPYAKTTIAVTRAFKNSETDSYDTDFIDVTLWGEKARDVANYAGKGSALSIRGRLTKRTLDFPGEAQIKTLGFTGEKVAFVSLKDPQMQPQVTPSQNEFEINDELIEAFAIENEPDKYASIIAKMKQTSQEIALDY